MPECGDRMHARSARGASVSCGASGTRRPPLTRAFMSLLPLVVAVALLTACAADSDAPASAAAPVYHVATTGSDTGDGSSARPWRTIQKAAGSVPSGAVVQVAAGTYDERVTVPSARSGSEAAPTRFVAEGTVTVKRGFVVQADYVTLEGFTVTPGEAGLAFRTGQVHVTGDHTAISGLTVRDTVSGAAVSYQGGASYNTLQDFTIHRPWEFGVVFGSHASAGGGYTTARYNTAQDGTITEHGGWCAVEMSGSYNTVDGVTIEGGPSGWNTRSQGTSAGMPYPDGDGIRVQGPNSTIRNTTIHDLWEWFHDTQHTDCIQFWTDADGLLIDSCLLGTWEPGPPPAERGGLAQEIGPSQIIMAGTVPSGQNITYTVENCLFLGQCGTNASIVSAAQSGATLKARLYNNTFWSSRPSLTPGSVLRNNIFRSFYVAPTTMALDSDHNVFCWVGGSGSNNVPASEGSSSLGRTYATRVDPQFVNPDVSATTDWGAEADFSVKAGSPAEGRGASRTQRK